MYIDERPFNLTQQVKQSMKKRKVEIYKAHVNTKINSKNNNKNTDKNKTHFHGDAAICTVSFDNRHTHSFLLKFLPFFPQLSAQLVFKVCGVRRCRINTILDRNRRFR